MTNGAVRARWWSKAILIGSFVALALLAIGALGSRLGMWSFLAGFGVLAAGAVLATLGVVGGIVGLIVAHRKRLAVDRPPLAIGTVISLAVLGYLGMQFNSAVSYPPIHNISTDVDDPPEFVAIVAVRGEQANPLAYDSATLAATQEAAYPWVRSLETELSPEESFDRARHVLEAMGIEIVSADRDAGIIEGTATTFWFGFKDDVVVRIRPTGSGSVVDMRSVSRVGRGDLGANARRIGEFLQRFET